jgi:hypothetical protein
MGEGGGGKVEKCGEGGGFGFFWGGRMFFASVRSKAAIIVGFIGLAYQGKYILFVVQIHHRVIVAF